MSKDGLRRRRSACRDSGCVENAQPLNGQYQHIIRRQFMNATSHFFANHGIGKYGQMGLLFAGRHGTARYTQQCIDITSLSAEIKGSLRVKQFKV